jgi:hypothetical protein
MLALPFGTSLILSLVYCVVHTEGVVEFDKNIPAYLDNYIDFNASIYIALMTVSFELKPHLIK